MITAAKKWHTPFVGLAKLGVIQPQSYPNSLELTKAQSQDSQTSGQFPMGNTCWSGPLPDFVHQRSDKSNHICEVCLRKYHPKIWLEQYLVFSHAWKGTIEKNTWTWMTIPSRKRFNNDAPGLAFAHLQITHPESPRQYYIRVARG